MPIDALEFKAQEQPRNVRFDVSKNPRDIGSMQQATGDNTAEHGQIGLMQDSFGFGGTPLEIGSALSFPVDKNSSLVPFTKQQRDDIEGPQRSDLWWSSASDAALKRWWLIKCCLMTPLFLIFLVIVLYGLLPPAGQ